MIGSGNVLLHPESFCESSPAKGGLAGEGGWRANIVNGKGLRYRPPTRQAFRGSGARWHALRYSEGRVRKGS
jgi:hypothetical protein